MGEHVNTNDMYAGDEKLGRLKTAVNGEVSREVCRLQEEAKQEKDAILNLANEEMMQAAFTKMQDNIKKLSGKYTRIVAKMKMESRQQAFLKREELAEQLFHNVSDKLQSFTQSSDYKQYLIDSIAGENISEDVELFLRPADMKFQSVLQKSIGKSIICKEDPSIRLGGLSVYFPLHNKLVDKTLDTCLKEQQEIFRQKNYLSFRESEKREEK